MNKTFTPKILLLLAFLCSLITLRAQSYEITNPIQIPLIYTQLDTGGYKWGIDLTIGNGTAPGLFEFDTGGTGFYAAYATNSSSPWWGSDVPIGSNIATNHYDSGLTYLGTAVDSTVTFWSNNGSGGYSSLVTATNVAVGQSTNIYKGATSNIFWNESGPTSTNPPIEGAFQGDFGMALAYNSNSLANIVSQLTYGNGITPGFIVNTPLSGSNGYVQIGLTAAQTNATGFNYFAMNPSTNAGTNNFANSGLSYKSEQLFNATMTLSSSAIANASNTYSTNIGITADTGAVPALHNTSNDPNFPTNLINGSVLTNGVSFTLSATNQNGILTNITSFTSAISDDYASNQAVVTVQNKNSIYPNYYYNSGLYLFNQNQVVYDLQNGNIGFGPIAVPEPSAAWLILTALSGLLIWRFVRNSRV